MLALVQRLDKSTLSPRCYLVGNTDSLGIAKATAAETSLQVNHSMHVLKTHQVRPHPEAVRRRHAW